MDIDEGLEGLRIRRAIVANFADAGIGQALGDLAGRILALGDVRTHAD